MGIQFDDFLLAVEPVHRDFVQSVHGVLQDADYKLKIEEKAAGNFAAYVHPKTKRSALNLFFRKKGLMVRIYPESLIAYADILNALPKAMADAIDKAPDCKRLLSPDDCNPKCATGYDFTVGGKRFRKCRFMCFQFSVTEESKPVLTAWIKREA